MVYIGSFISQYTLQFEIFTDGNTKRKCKDKIICSKRQDGGGGKGKRRKGSRVDGRKEDEEEHSNPH